MNGEKTQRIIESIEDLDCHLGTEPRCADVLVAKRLRLLNVSADRKPHHLTRRHRIGCADTRAYIVEILRPRDIGPVRITRSHKRQARLACGIERALQSVEEP